MNVCIPTVNFLRAPMDEDCKVSLEGEDIENVKTLRYLEAMLSADGGGVIRGLSSELEQPQERL